MLSLQANDSRKFNIPTLTAAQVLTLWCDRCRQDSLLVLTGQNFQIAWCQKCRSTLYLALLLPGSEHPSIVETAVQCWFDLKTAFLIVTARGLIRIKVDRRKVAIRSNSTKVIQPPGDPSVQSKNPDHPPETYHPIGWRQPQAHSHINAIGK